MKPRDIGRKRKLAGYFLFLLAACVMGVWAITAWRLVASGGEAGLEFGCAAPLLATLLLLLTGGLLLVAGILEGRRAVIGKCKECGYSLTGLADGAPCPECGKASAVGAVNTPASGD